MNSRREFFSQFIGQVGVLRNDALGVEKIPLNRLKELPDSIVQNIKPVFFPDESWYLKDRLLCIPNRKNDKNNELELNEPELNVLEYFKKGVSLKQVALEIKGNSEMSFDEIYQTVTSLFFKLASMRLCHPSEVYKVDEIIKSNQQLRG